MTLIDKLFTNQYDIDDNTLQGIFVADISDYYMIFYISYNCSPIIEEYQLIRLINESRMTKCKERIRATVWSTLDVYDTCESYFCILRTFLICVLMKHFSIEKGSTKIVFRGCLQVSGNLSFAKTNHTECLWSTTLPTISTFTEINQTPFRKLTKTNYQWFWKTKTTSGKFRESHKLFNKSTCSKSSSEFSNNTRILNDEKYC